MDDEILIMYDGAPMVIVNLGGGSSDDLLSWYAREYAFDLTRLSCKKLAVIKYDRSRLRPETGS